MAAPLFFLPCNGLGAEDGAEDGDSLGWLEGSEEGAEDGDSLGWLEGSEEGAEDVELDGAEDVDG